MRAKPVFQANDELVFFIKLKFLKRTKLLLVDACLARCRWSSHCPDWLDSRLRIERITVTTARRYLRRGRHIVFVSCRAMYGSVVLDSCKKVNFK